MNRGVLQQSSPVQQMMAGNPNWWRINATRPPSHQQAEASSFLHLPTTFFPQFTPPTSSSSSASSLPIPSLHDNQELPESWCQLLLGGLEGEEEKGGCISQFQVQPKKLVNWEEQALNANSVVDVKRENSATSYVYGHANEDFHRQATKPTAWSHQILSAAAASSPKSCVTSFGGDMLDFSGNKADGRQPPPDRSSECNSTATGGTLKKARFQPSVTQSTLKVRKEKLGDRITSLHQLVSPFGKTDTASVLSEAIGYIRFLQSQIEALSLPYLGGGNKGQQHSKVQGERNCIFPEDPGQLVNENCMKRKGGPDQQDCHKEPKKDLRSRGLCLVPVSCTLEVGSSDNGADYWAPSLGGGFR